MAGQSPIGLLTFLPDPRAKSGLLNNWRTTVNQTNIMHTIWTQAISATNPRAVIVGLPVDQFTNDYSKP